MTGRSPGKPDAAFAGRGEMPRGNTEVGCDSARGMLILNNDHPWRSVIEDERSCAPCEKKYSGGKSQHADKHRDLLSHT
jgi:hypothetical protein